MVAHHPWGHAYIHTYFTAAYILAWPYFRVEVQVRFLAPTRETPIHMEKIRLSLLFLCWCLLLFFQLVYCKGSIAGAFCQKIQVRVLGANLYTEEDINGGIGSLTGLFGLRLLFFPLAFLGDGVIAILLFFIQSLHVPSRNSSVLLSQWVQYEIFEDC